MATRKKVGGLKAEELGFAADINVKYLNIYDQQQQQQQKLNKSLLKDLPYFNFRGNLVLAHGQFNNSLNSELPTKRDLDKLHSLYDLDLFNLNMAFDTNQTDSDALMSQCIRSRYFSPHSHTEIA